MDLDRLGKNSAKILATVSPIRRYIKLSRF